MITVLMSVYNAEEYLGSAIDSILNQTYGDFEFIIINDGSSDKSKDIIRSFSDKRIKLIDNDKNSGLIFSLNKGIDNASGKYIARMDADDISLPTRFQKQFDYLESNNDIALVGSTAILIDELGHEKNKIGITLPSNQIFCQLFFGNMFIHTSVMGLTEVFRKYKYNINYFLAEDYLLWSQIAKDLPVFVISEPLVKYRFHQASVSVLGKEQQDECVKKILKFHLVNIGIQKPTKQDMDLHYKLLNNQIDYSTLTKTETWQILCWIKKLVNQNNKLKRYNIEYFNSKLDTHWNNSFNYFSSYNYGIKAIPLIWFFFNRHEKIKVKVLFILRCLKAEIRNLICHK